MKLRCISSPARWRIFNRSQTAPRDEWNVRRTCSMECQRRVMHTSWNVSGTSCILDGMSDSTIPSLYNSAALHACLMECQRHVMHAQSNVRGTSCVLDGIPAVRHACSMGCQTHVMNSRCHRHVMHTQASVNDASCMLDMTLKCWSVSHYWSTRCHDYNGIIVMTSFWGRAYWRQYRDMSSSYRNSYLGSVCSVKDWINRISRNSNQD